MNHDLHYDYTTVGHVTVDVLADGSKRPGGTAFYSALQAARLGCRALILTRGASAEIERLLEPFRAELDVRVEPAAHTTTLLTRGTGARRSQRVLAWAGPIAELPAIDTAILHLAPVALELREDWRGHAGFVGLTPQGLARAWSSEGVNGEMRAAPASRGAIVLAARCQALVCARHERLQCSALIAAAREAGAAIAVTAGPEPTSLETPATGMLELSVPALRGPLEDLGAGDVFAAAFFVALHDGRDAPEAVRFAHAAAAVRMLGTSGTRAEIEQRLSRSAPRRSAR